ncbi:iron complex transport system ATP-binding protein [Croceifilum oryzae]|uniref:Iron complex transport system ATP-binding protein n=1 Tax=Croceifilum oryzae TaxID=1553429 RepID=A0AAJ1TGQ7_9BACL|nr:ABC transporter ATP-binding protein [Croceifilum oryzae]MDQ0418580.1 iron complex transport system ATP-binding protein [Croceifilum oryzae]
MLSAKQLRVRYKDKLIISGLDIAFETGKVYSILGPNGCGKSTLLKALAKQLSVHSGTILLDNIDIQEWGPKPFAKILAFLRQSYDQMIDVHVRDLVTYGRFPHKRFLQQVDKEDEQIIDWALQLTNLTHLAKRKMSSLSGGERQRAWIAMALAQQPRILLLDEPTTYLDIVHQLEIMELIQQLNQQFHITVIMVLHDLNHASLYSDYVIVLKEGSIFRCGTPEQVMNEETLKKAFGVDAKIETDEESNRPYIRSLKLGSRSS